MEYVMKLRLLISLSVALGLVGCSMGHDELEKLCKKDAGTVIYKQVKADGYYDNNCTGACWLPLLDGSFQFIEIYNPTDRNYYNPGKGYWHIYLSKANDPDCYSKVTKGEKHKLGTNQCIAFKKINDITAEYAVKRSSEATNLENLFDSRIFKRKTTVYETKTEGILGERINYSLDLNKNTSGDGGGKTCYAIKAISPPEFDLIDKVLTNFK